MIIKKYYKLFIKIKSILGNFFKIVFKKKINQTIPKLHSRSELEFSYCRSVTDFLQNDQKFSNFRRNKEYMRVLGGKNLNVGKYSLERIKKIGIFKIEDLDKTIRCFDEVGNPILHDYNEIKKISINTLRYLMTVSEIINTFKINNFYKIAEIGIGYGGQTVIMDKFLKTNKFYLFDLPIVNQLSEKYIEHFLLNSSYEVSTINQFNENINFDLVISTYGFSELPKETQLKYIDKILKISKKGYLLMNNTSTYKNLSIEDLKEYLPPFEIKEAPDVLSDTCVLIWGHK